MINITPSNKNIFTGTRSSLTYAIYNDKHMLQNDTQQRSMRDALRQTLGMKTEKEAKNDMKSTLQPLHTIGDARRVEQPNVFREAVEYLIENTVMQRNVIDPYNPKIKKSSVTDLKNREKALKPKPVKQPPSTTLAEKMRRVVRSYIYKVPGEAPVPQPVGTDATKLELQPKTYTK